MVGKLLDTPVIGVGWRHLRHTDNRNALFKCNINFFAMKRHLGGSKHNSNVLLYHRDYSTLNTLFEKILYKNIYPQLSAKSSSNINCLRGFFAIKRQLGGTKHILNGLLYHRHYSTLNKLFNSS